MPAPSRLQIIPLGGLGEFGMNLMVYRWGDDAILVDAGMMFPGQEHLGVDVVLPDLSYLEECGRIHGVVLTHGHEDHIGAVPYLLARHDVPLFATGYTRGLIRRKLDERGLASGNRLQPLPEGEASLTLGPFTIQTIATAHSIPQSRMILLRTPLGNVVHTADFKLDADSVGVPGTDLATLARIGREGVLVLLSDSTNADRPGMTASESSVGAGIDRILTGASARVVITTFASHVHRLARIARLAQRHGRKLAVVGSALERHLEVAEGLGILDIPAGVRQPPDAVASLHPRETLVVASGSQGEPMSAMARIAVGKHRHVEIEDGDLVIHSARKIPGNEKSIARMVDHCLRRGAEVISADEAPVHVSGHGAQEELRFLLQMLRPRYVVPIHGEYRQLRAHARLAVDSGIPIERVRLADSGDVITVDEGSIELAGRVHVGQVFMDATQDEVDWTILRDRRRIAADGIVVPVVAVDRDSGAVNGLPEIMTRGFVPDGGKTDQELMLEARRVVADALAEATPEERTDEGLLKARIQTELKRFFRRKLQRRPLIIPVIVEL